MSLLVKMAHRFQVIKGYDDGMQYFQGYFLSIFLKTNEIYQEIFEPIREDYYILEQNYKLINLSEEPID